MIRARRCCVVDFEIDIFTTHRGAKFVFNNSKRNDDANTGSCTAAKSWKCSMAVNTEPNLVPLDSTETSDAFKSHDYQV